MEEKDFADIIRLARRAPLQNMDEAEAAAALLQRFAAFANECLEEAKQGDLMNDGHRSSE